MLLSKLKKNPSNITLFSINTNKIMCASEKVNKKDKIKT